MVMSERREFLKAAPLALGAAMAAGSSLLSNLSSAVAADAPQSASGEYVLPPLPYEYNALEPHIDEQTMRLHHDLHHKSYVDGLNAALSGIKKALDENDPNRVPGLAKDASFHGSGHILHSIFWPNMSPKGGGAPKGDFAKALDASFGSFERFQTAFTTAASKVEGSGWGILAYEPLGKRLVTLQAEKHQNLTQWGAVPLLVLDVWEHAYYLKYQNKRADYVKAFWNVIDWSNVASRYDKAAKMT
jgi:Fe-Mn family superoxide dismutase